MPGSAEDADAVRQGDLQHAARLCAVRDEAELLFPAECADLPPRQDLTGDVGAERADDRLGIRADEPRKGVDVRLLRDAVPAFPGFGKRIDRAHHGVVLQPRHDDMPAASHNALNGDIERVGAVRCEHDPFRFGAEHGSDVLAGRIQQLRAAHGDRVTAASGAAVGLHRLIDCLPDFCRLRVSRGGIVKIDRHAPPRSGVMSLTGTPSRISSA